MSVDDNRYTPVKSRLGSKPIDKKKLEKLKKVEPSKSFIVKTTPETAGVAKASLLNDLTKIVKTPLFRSNRMLARGDLEIVPANAETLAVVRSVMLQDKTLLSQKGDSP